MFMLLKNAFQNNFDMFGNELMSWNALSKTLKILEAETKMQSQYILTNVGDLQSPMQDP